MLEVKRDDFDESLEDIMDMKLKRMKMKKMRKNKYILLIIKKF